MSDSPIFSDRLEDALSFVVRVHGTQRRKTGPGEDDGPSYLGHLLGTAALVIEDGGSEDEVIAALLHDTIEDTDTSETDIATRFGREVATIVAGCTDADVKPKPPWRERKERYLAHLSSAPRSVLRVSNADKLYNARTILADVRELGDVLWVRFNVGKEGQLWYYAELARTFREHNPGFLADELNRVVDDLRNLSD
jgi:(p)ppGpp synthase/HD superfamily hydrolase